MQDPKDETKFCIVERYEQESSQQYHLSNPVRPRPSIPSFVDEEVKDALADMCLVLEGQRSSYARTHTGEFVLIVPDLRPLRHAAARWADGPDALGGDVVGPCPSTRITQQMHLPSSTSLAGPAIVRDPVISLAPDATAASTSHRSIPFPQQHRASCLIVRDCRLLSKEPRHSRQPLFRGLETGLAHVVASLLTTGDNVTAAQSRSGGYLPGHLSSALSHLFASHERVTSRQRS